MSEAEPMQQALTLPNGARFYKCALRVNPFAYLARPPTGATPLHGRRDVTPRSGRWQALSLITPLGMGHTALARGSVWEKNPSGHLLGPKKVARSSADAVQ